MIDVEQLKEHFDNDQELYLDSRELLLERVPALLAEIKEAVKAKDSNQIQSRAHAMKGMVSNFFADELVRFLQEIESAGKSGQPVNEASFSNLATLSAKFIEEVKQVNLI